jgi:uncharacterized membrane protein
MSAIASIPLFDDIALAIFLAAWLGYPLFIRLLGPGAINAGLHDIRVLWMRSMAARDNRIVDSSLIGHVVHSASFFASTSLIAIGALIGVLTGLDRLQPAIEGLGANTPRALLEFRILLPLAVLVQGLFHLTWALRQLNYSVALIGATPPMQAGSALAGELAEVIGDVLSSALTTFNAGIRSYYFALVALAWLISPAALIFAACALTVLLLHRQGRSSVSVQMRRARALMLRAHGRDPAP